MASKKDIKQVRAIAKAHGLSAKDRRRFGAYIHKQKQHGRRGSKENGDFDWQELEELIHEFMGHRDA
ncbi:MAG: hypothetical protein KY476_00795 [Planctomycetes bacterium]|nr:hypothetical protein [Planctomycetota bacterium]